MQMQIQIQIIFQMFIFHRYCVINSCPEIRQKRNRIDDVSWIIKTQLSLTYIFCADDDAAATAAAAILWPNKIVYSTE